MAKPCQQRLTQPRFAQRLALCHGRDTRSRDSRHHAGPIAAGRTGMNQTNGMFTDNSHRPAPDRHMSPDSALHPPSGWIGHTTNGGPSAQSDDGHPKASDRAITTIHARVRWACAPRLPRTLSGPFDACAETTGADPSRGSAVQAGMTTARQAGRNPDRTRAQRCTVSSAVRRVSSWRRGNASQSPGTVTAKAPATAAVESRSPTSRPVSRHAR